MINTIACTVTEELAQPFGLSSESIWAIGIILPVLISVIGWFTIYWLNIKNMKLEKKIIVKIQAYDHIKTYITKMNRSFGELCNYTFEVHDVMKRFSAENVLYELDKKKLLRDLENSTFKSIYNQANIDFVEFVFSWEQYEIVFSELVKQRYALQDELKEINEIYGYVVMDLERYSIYLRENIEIPEELRKADLEKALKEMFERLLDFNACIRDMSFNLQNHTFEKVISERNEKREVANSNIPTIENLVKKHGHE